jgi:hypothetical protein
MRKTNSLSFNRGFCVGFDAKIRKPGPLLGIVLFLLALAGCDTYDLNLSFFIKKNTFVVTVAGMEFRSAGITREDGTMVIPPAEEGSDVSTLAIQLDNPQDFAVSVSLLPPTEGVKAELSGNGEVLITIAGAVLEEVYDFSLELYTGNGRRDFGIYNLPVIQCDSLHFDFLDEAAEAAELELTKPSLSLSEDTPLCASISAAFDSYEWYLDEVLQPDTGPTLERTARDFTAGPHRITCKLIKDDRLYSKSAEFEVTR